MPKLISDLAIMLLTAGVVAVIFKRFKQPLVLGYILAGFLVGPFMPWFFTVADSGSIETWSEIGIIVLMFALGLEFNLHKLVSVGKAAIITAVTGVLGMLLIGYLVGQAMGWGSMNSVFLGGMLSMSSTIIVIKVFDELDVGQKNFAQLACGTLVIQDIAGVFMMIILSTVSVSKSISGGALALQLGMLVLYLAMWLILGIYILPTLLRKASKFLNDETLMLVSLGICFGMVLLAEELGFSSALGAFLAGSLLAGTVHAERVEHLTSGIKDLFGSVFFLSVGMMIEPSMIVKYIVPILIITFVTLAGKLVMNAMGVLLSGQSLETAVRGGCSLAQIGEFAFIIAALGMSLGVIGDFLYPIIVAVSVITTLTTPIFIKGSGKLYALIEKVLPQRVSKKLEQYTGDDSDDEEQDSDWANFLRRFVKRTALYGVLMAGVSLLGQFVLYPILEDTPLQPWMVQAICTAFCVAGVALFIRPMLDLHSTEYTTLWVKNRHFRLPLITLTALRFVLIVLLVFFPLRILLGINRIWLLLMIAAVIFLIYKSGWMSSAYISAEARFIANLNERSLHRNQDDTTQWLDETLFVQWYECSDASAGKTLKQLNWGYLFSVNVVKVVRGKRHFDMPSGNMELREGDRLLILGKPEDLRSFRMGLGREDMPELSTLRRFMEEQADQEDETADLYVYALPVRKDSALQGKTIKTSGLKDSYDCMILGLQRDRLPILQPDVNMTIQTNDLVWVLGARKMVEKLLAKDLSET